MQLPGDQQCRPDVGILPRKLHVGAAFVTLALQEPRQIGLVVMPAACSRAERQFRAGQQQAYAKLKIVAAGIIVRIEATYLVKQRRAGSDRLPLSTSV